MWSVARMKRFIQHSFLKPEKIEDYINLHANAWPGVLQMITTCNIRNYSISIRGTELYTYYEYIGDDYEADMARMAADPLTQEWWKQTRPCFLYHEQGVYYDDLREIFYCE